MMYQALSTRQVQRLDTIAIEKIGIPSLVLMENAGRAVGEEALRHLKKVGPNAVSIFCGLGNNAGDGFVTARYLMNAGIRPDVFLIGKFKDLKADAATNCRILKRLLCPVKEISRVDVSLLRNILGSRLIIDAIFGVGLNRPIAEPFKSIIEAINAGKKFVVSVDVPSGLDATTGKIYGVCVKASVTATLSCVKKGFFKNEGPRHAGRIIVADIGIPLGLL